MTPPSHRTACKNLRPISQVRMHRAIIQTSVRLQIPQDRRIHCFFHPDPSSSPDPGQRWRGPGLSGRKRMRKRRRVRRQQRERTNAEDQAHLVEHFSASNVSLSLLANGPVRLPGMVAVYVGTRSIEGESEEQKEHEKNDDIQKKAKPRPPSRSTCILLTSKDHIHSRPFLDPPWAPSRSHYHPTPPMGSPHPMKHYSNPSTGR